MQDKTRAEETAANAAVDEAENSPETSVNNAGGLETCLASEEEEDEALESFLEDEAAFNGVETRLVWGKDDARLEIVGRHVRLVYSFMEAQRGLKNRAVEFRGRHVRFIYDRE